MPHSPCYWTARSVATRWQTRFAGPCHRCQGPRHGMRPGGLEPPTYWFEASYSIQLSYGRSDQDILPSAPLSGNLLDDIPATQRHRLTAAETAVESCVSRRYHTRAASFSQRGSAQRGNAASVRMSARAQSPRLDSMVGVAQLVRALGCGPRGRGFESRHPPLKSSQ